MRKHNSMGNQDTKQKKQKPSKVAERIESLLVNLVFFYITDYRPL